MKHLPLLLTLLILSPMSQVVAACEMPSQFTAGDVVVINPGEPQNVRVEPSVSAELLFKLPAGEYLTILDGPTCADGYTWWQVMYGWEAGWTADAPAGGGEAWLSAPEMVMYETGGIRFRAPESLISGVTWEDFDWIGGDGFDIPPRRVFTLEGYPLPEAWAEYVERTAISVRPLDDSEDNLADIAQTYTDALGNEPIVPFEEVKQGAYLRFESGVGRRGVGYPSPLFPFSRLDLFISYSFRGYTADGRYEVSAGFPLSEAIAWPEYPASLGEREGDGDEEDQRLYDAWVDSIHDLLDTAPPDTFTPRLALLDAVVRSIEITEPIIITPGSSG